MEKQAGRKEWREKTEKRVAAWKNRGRENKLNPCGPMFAIDSAIHRDCFPDLD